jgi:carboxypeptidase PM20D1
MKRILKLFAVLLILLALLAGALLIKTLLFTSRQPDAGAGFTAADLDRAEIVTRLQKALTIPTISYTDRSKMDPAPFEALHAHLETAFPLVHAHCRKETVSEHGILFTWEGSDSALKPIALLAHMDVVAAPGGDRWEHPPFAGRVADGCIWGRGALDDKQCLMAILEAMEMLIAEGFQPKRTLYAAFGHDEEIGGDEGAAKIAALLAARGIRLECTLDEGLAVVEKGMIPGLDKEAALIGISEKGYLTLKLEAKGPGGHSSQPAAENTIGILCNAVARVTANPFPAKLQGPMRDMFLTLGPEMNFPMRMVFANLWLFEPLILRQLAAETVTNAAVRTTTAPTIIEGGYKENVLPETATATINFRLMPGVSAENVLNHVSEAVNDERVRVTAEGHRTDAAEPADIESPSYRLISTTIKQLFPEAVVAPSMTLGGTDSKHYETVAENTYRFLPLRLTEEDAAMIHGMNERINIDKYLYSIQFYIQFIRNMQEM